jgi:hypothetical protein
MREKKFIQIIRSGQRPFVTFRKNLIFYGEELLASRPSWRTNPCRLPSTSYLVYLEAVSYIRNLRARHAVVRGAQENI